VWTYCQFYRTIIYSSLLMPSSRSSTRRLESSLYIIRHQSTRHDSRVLSIDQRLGSMELALTSQHPAEPCDLAPSCSSTLFGNRLEFGALDLAVTRPPGTPYDRPASSATEADGPMRKPSFDASLFQEAAPESYTTRTGVPILLHSYGSEIAASEYIRVYQFAFSYCKSPRKWIRFTLRITASVESRYWILRTINTFGLNKSRSHELPGSLTSMLEKSLASFRDLDQNSCLTVFLGKDSQGVEERNDSILPIKLSRPSFQVKEYLRKITSMIYHWDCPRYPDRQFDQRPRCRYRPTNSFIVRLHARWVLASRFGSDKFYIDRDLYILRALHHLKGAPGITPFLGVLFDDNDIISGYLSELPAAGKLGRVMADATQSGQPVTWARRERWCRQIVQAVAQMHSQEYVVGFLGEQPDCGIGIASNDNAVLYGRFSTTFRYLPNKWCTPPECKQSASASGAIAATPETDLYQLGLLLWRIAANKSAVAQIDSCKTAGCTTGANAICLEPHADPVQLPSPDEHIPQYVRVVIAECRWELPGRRLPASELLKMFPSLAENAGTPTNDSPCAKDEELLARPEECLDKWGEMVVCNRCDEKTTHHFYHCSICHSSDYDLCHGCFLKGSHCFERDHHLREYSELHDEEKYYTSIKENGKRDVIIL
jgi:hypothetical protein